MAGGAAGLLVHRFAPFPTADPGAYALVGMGTLFAGIIRAPMTSVFMIFEITQDYQILVPLMVANMLSFVISRRFQPVPLYHALLHQDGIHLPSAATQASMASRTARDVMRADVIYIDSEMPLDLAWQGVVDHQATGYVVGTPEQFIGAITRQQLEEWHTSSPNDPLALLVKGLPSVHVHPDHPLDVVLDRLSQSDGILAVVSRTDTRRVEGIVTPDSILLGRDRRVAGGRAVGRAKADASE
jgi:CIC family chloride channel protein